ncbi:RsiV family protein [Paenibacillus silvae]|uniref:RsiV family protein n=1 Tax=Paenibacillus silvae TaxID=1325358 RepID=UPI0025A05948|nr:RsiV family protein [Paenibacillus silvae]MDM5280052.1 RsiV family protein [Paenibacillus silvae]
MKRKTLTGAVLILLFAMWIPSYSAYAANAISVKTKVYTYKGQQYVQITGGDKQIAEKINKTLKYHAVMAASDNADMKKIQKGYYVKSVGKTKYISDQRLSVLYTNSNYGGGVHSNEWSTSYNFDLKTGKRIYLNHVVPTSQQKYNMYDGIGAGLKLNKDAYEESRYQFPLTPKTSFYFTNNGISVVFDPYEVGPYAVGFIEVKVAFDKINVDTYATMFNLSKDVPATIKEGMILGLDGVFIGQTRADLAEVMKNIAGESYVDDGHSRLYKDLKYVLFNFDGDKDTAQLSEIYFDTKAFPMRTFKDVEQVLGKVKRYKHPDYNKGQMIIYEYGSYLLGFDDENIKAIMIAER